MQTTFNIPKILTFATASKQADAQVAKLVDALP